MAKSYSRDLRVRVIAAVDGGMSRRGAAEQFAVSESTAIRWVREWRASGRTDARSRGGDRHSHRIEEHGDFLKARIEEMPDITLDELRQALLTERGETFGDSSISRFFRRHKLSRKKRPGMRRSKTAKT